MANAKQRHLYGAWYLDPLVWNKIYKHQMRLHSSDLRESLRQTTLCASLPWQVNMLGAIQPVSELQANKAFSNFPANLHKVHIKI